MLRKLPTGFAVVIALGVLLAADSPEVMKLKAQIQQYEKFIDKLQTDLKARDRDADKNKTDLVKALTELREKDATIVKLNQLIKANDKSAEELKTKEKELDKVQRELSRSKFDLEKAKDDLTKAQAGLKKTQTDFDVLKNAPFVHTVVFYLKTDAPEGQADLLIKDAHELLAKINSVRGLWVGKPAEKGTPEKAITDFQVGLLVLFDDVAGLQKYRDDPKHKEFLEKHGKHIEKAAVYDVTHQKAK